MKEVTIAVLIFIFLLIVVNYLFNTYQRDQTLKTRRRDPQKKYRAVGVRHPLNSCRAARRLENMRFLAAQAPHFPLPDCDIELCRCQYIYFADRRDEERRTAFGIARTWSPAVGLDRRHGDRRRQYS